MPKNTFAFPSPPEALFPSSSILSIPPICFPVYSTSSSTTFTPSPHVSVRSILIIRCRESEALEATIKNRALFSYSMNLLNVGGRRKGGFEYTGTLGGVLVGGIALAEPVVEGAIDEASFFKSGSDGTGVFSCSTSSSSMYSAMGCGGSNTIRGAAEAMGVGASSMLLPELVAVICIGRVSTVGIERVSSSIAIDQRNIVVGGGELAFQISNRRIALDQCTLHTARKSEI